MARDDAFREAEEKIEEARRTGATQLDLSGMQLTALPESLGQLTQLQTLEMMNCRGLTALPSAIYELTNLEVLIVAGSPIKSISPQIASLVNLKTLSVIECALKAIPPELGTLTALVGLSIGDGKFGDRHFGSNVKANTNRIAALPEQLAGLVNLEWLALGNSGEFHRIPAWLGSLSRLRSVDLSSLGIQDIPDSISNLSNLEELILADNPLNPELAAAYEEGLDAVKAYLRAKAEDQIVLNEAKLILIGEGEVGKSCLLDALRGVPYREHDSTHGIRLAPVKVKDDGTETVMTLNGWDFGGQRVYRPTHQLFFSSPAVYLVVWKPREGLKAGQVAEWIKLIKHREPEARVLVVSTHGDDRQPDIDQHQLISEFGSDTVLGFHKVDSQPANYDADDKSTWAGPRTGIDELRAAIATVAANLPEMGRTVPAKWQRVRERLEKCNLSWMHWDEFVSFCTEHEDTSAVLDVDQIDVFAKLSHTLGQIIHYDYDTTLKDIVILKPDWLATAISFALDDAQTRELHGLVSFERLSFLWNNPARPAEEQYPEELHLAFRRLMERFDLSYPVVDPTRGSVADTCLITQLVAETRPGELPSWEQESNAGDYEQQQVCRILDRKKNESANAEGLFFQLIARLSNYSLGKIDHGESVHWKYGLMLQDELGSRALLEHVGNDVRITVRAPYPGRFLGILTEHVQALVESFWEGLRCEITVPCLETCRRENNPSGLLAVRVLIDSKRKGRPEQPCPVCNEWQDIDRLLTNSPVSPAADSIDSTPIEDVMAELVAIREELGEGLLALREGAERHERRELNRFRALNSLQRRRISQVDEQFGKMLTALTDEAKDGPRLFSFQPMETGFFDRPNWISEKFRLTLWCEHSRRPLTHRDLNGSDTSNGVYDLTLPREWFVRAAPWLRRLGNTLGLVLPILSPAAKVLTDDDAYQSFGDELKLGVKCAETFLKGSGHAGEWLEKSDSPDMELGEAIRA